MYNNNSLPAVVSTVGAGGAAVDKNNRHLLELYYSNRLNYIAFTLQIENNNNNNNF